MQKTDNIKFTWTMTEKDFVRLQKDLKTKGYVSDNTYNGFGAGRLFIDILTMSYEELYGDDEDRNGENFLTTYPFVAGQNSGYGEFPDKTPYDLVNDGINPKNINVTGSYEEFKASFEKEVLRAANEESCCDQWNEWMLSNEYSDTVKKYWYNNAA